MTSDNSKQRYAKDLVCGKCGHDCIEDSMVLLSPTLVKKDRVRCESCAEKEFIETSKMIMKKNRRLMDELAKR